MITKHLFIKGIKLLGISIVLRIGAFIFFSNSWQWSSLFVRGLEVLIGIVFMSSWLLYGMKIKEGFKKGSIVGAIGAIDGLILTIISIIMLLNSGSYYFGPIEMAIWVMPLMGILNLLDFMPGTSLYAYPIIGVLLTGMGSYISKKVSKKMAALKGY